MAFMPESLKLSPRKQTHGPISRLLFRHSLLFPLLYSRSRTAEHHSGLCRHPGTEGSHIAADLVRFKDDIDRPLAAILTLNTIAHTVGAIGVGHRPRSSSVNPCSKSPVFPSSASRL